MSEIINNIQIFDQTVLRNIWPLDIGCTCLSIGFFTVLLTFLMIGLLAFFLYRSESAREDNFFIFIFIGFIFLGASEFVDWWQSVMVSNAGALLFYPELYMVQELLKVVGFLIILITFFRSLKRF